MSGMFSGPSKCINVADHTDSIHLCKVSWSGQSVTTGAMPESVLTRGLSVIASSRAVISLLLLKDDRKPRSAFILSGDRVPDDTSEQLPSYPSSSRAGRYNEHGITAS